MIVKSIIDSISIQVHKIIHSRRRTIGLTITPEATLVVRAPMWTPRWHIEKFIRQEQAWIAKKLREIQSRPQATQHHFLPSEKFLYLGKTYQLRFGNARSVHLGEYLTIPAARRIHAREVLTHWYKQQAHKVVAIRSKYYAKRMGLSFKSIKISNASTRWGSCGHRDSLNINWRLVMAPLSVLDYVVVHELAHVEHKHHGTRFWEAVAEILPDYRRSRTWLRFHGHLLKF